MKFISVCSGIEAASVAWNPIGWKAVAFSEIEPFPCAVLAHHYPGTPNYGDMTKFQEWPDHAIDLLCGGTPCQSFSVAGLRKGLEDPRGNLMLTFGAIAAKYRPQWLVWENVPGVLSSNGGRDFGAFLGMLGELGYGVAYRVLDAQYFGVAQRRRRVFVVGCLGDWRSAAAVLFERYSLQGHSAPSRKAREVAPTIPSRSTGGVGLGTDFDCDGGLIPAISQCITTGTGQRYDPETETETETIFPVAFDTTQITSAANYSNPKAGGPCHPLAAGMHAPAVAFAIQAGALRTNPASGPDGVGVQADHAYTLEARAEVQAVAFQERGRESGRSLEIGGEIAYALTAPSGGGRAQERNVLTPTMQVRRMTPEECEALQGFPRSYTAIPWRKKPASECPDGPRYKALGNSWAVPNVRWIGQQIEAVEAIRQHNTEADQTAMAKDTP
jgi:DNA (cytosine-5)-methyltransferase 1